MSGNETVTARAPFTYAHLHDPLKVDLLHFMDSFYAKVKDESMAQIFYGSFSLRRVVVSSS